MYRPAQLALAAGDRIRVTTGGTTKDGKHRLSTGTLLTLHGFNRRGDLVVDHGWVIDKDWGHIAHGYAMTSHASQGATVDKVFVGISSQSLPATDQRTAYVALTRGREKAVLFTNDRAELLKAVNREDDPMSATDLNGSAEDDAKRRNGQKNEQALARGLGMLGQQRNPHAPAMENQSRGDTGPEHGR